MNTLLLKIKNTPERITFNEVIEYINSEYVYTPAQFSNGKGNEQVINEAASNEGSCKIFSFALLEQLTKQQTLNCFGDFYRIDVLENPQNTDHANIRNFIQYGFEGIHFSTDALVSIK